MTRLSSHHSEPAVVEDLEAKTRWRRVRDETAVIGARQDGSDLQPKPQSTPRSAPNGRARALGIGDTSIHLHHAAHLHGDAEAAAHLAQHVLGRDDDTVKVDDGRIGSSNTHLRRVRRMEGTRSR
jgi:hypothetical protein